MTNFKFTQYNIIIWKTFKRIKTIHVNYFKIARSGNANVLRPFNEVIYNAEVDKINDDGDPGQDL